MRTSSSFCILLQLSKQTKKKCRNFSPAFLLKKVCNCKATSIAVCLKHDPCSIEQFIDPPYKKIIKWLSQNKSLTGEQTFNFGRRPISTSPVSKMIAFKISSDPSHTRCWGVIPDVEVSYQMLRCHARCWGVMPDVEVSCQMLRCHAKPVKSDIRLASNEINSEERSSEMDPNMPAIAPVKCLTVKNSVG